MTNELEALRAQRLRDQNELYRQRCDIYTLRDDLTRQAQRFKYLARACETLLDRIEGEHPINNDIRHLRSLLNAD